MKNKFTPLSDKEKSDFAPLFETRMPKPFQDINALHVLKTTLSFYPDWTFVDVDYSDQPGQPHVFAFINKNEMVVLDGDPQAICAFNDTAPLKLASGNVLSYLDFFLRHSRPEQGRLRLVEGIDDFRWREEPPQAARKAISGMIQPAALTAYDEEHKTYRVNFHALFHHNLLSVQARIDQKGRVEITDRNLQVEDIPLLDDVLER